MMILDLKFIYDGANTVESSWDFDMEVFAFGRPHIFGFLMSKKCNFMFKKILC